MKADFKKWIRTAADKTAVKQGCYFDAKYPDQVIKFIETYCRQSKAPWFDMPIVLMDWQKDLINRLYGWRNRDGTQRHKDLFLFCPKKQGKSTLISCLSLFHLCRDAGAHVAVLARTKQQAGIIYDEARNMADLDAKLKTFLKSTKTTRLIEDRKRKSKIEVMAADGSTSGFNCSAIFLDEFAAWRPSQQREVWQQIQNATAARKDSLKVILTTAQFDKSTICYDFYRQAKKVVEGEDSDNITLLPIIYEVGEHEDWTDENNWWKAAPSAGVTVPKSEWRNDFARCKGNAFAEGTFRTLMLNQWVGHSDSFIASNLYDACQEDFKESDFYGSDAYLGIDLAKRHDLAGLVVTIQKDDNYYVLPYPYSPKEGAERKARLDNVPYLEWSKQGYIELTDGDVIDVSKIVDDIRELSTKFNISEIRYDGWGMEQTRQLLEAEGFNVVEVSPHMNTISPPTAFFERLIKENKLKHNGHPILKWCIGNCTVRSDQQERIAIDKRKCTARIDLAMATILSLSGWLANDADSDQSSILDFLF